MPDNFETPENREDFSRMQNNQPAVGQTLSVGQKTAVVFLVFFALFIVILWGYQFQNAINQPFDRRDLAADKTADQTGTCANGDCYGPSDNDLRGMDTDRDGLSDYDELNIYKTSPYLEDSDSDGFSDQNEILSDNDPNCPVGRDCYGALLDADYDIEASVKTGQEETTGAAIEQPAGDSVNINDVFSADINPAELREILTAAGMSAEALGQISDEDLMRTYQEILLGSD